MDGEVERIVIGGKEIKVQMDREAYAGEWVKEAFAARRNNPDRGLLAGHATDRRGQLRLAVLAPDNVNEHCGIFGMTGAGKTTFLTNLMIQWGFTDHGFCFVAPFREEARELLYKLPADRLEDVVWIETNPRHSESLFDGDTNRVVPVDVFNIGPSASHSAVVDPSPQQIVAHFIDVLKEKSRSSDDVADDLTKICRELLPIFIHSDELHSLADVSDLWSPTDETTELRSFLHRSDAADVWQTVEQIKERDEEILWGMFPFIDHFMNISMLPSDQLTTNTPLPMAEAISENNIIIVAGNGMTNRACQRLQMIAGTIVQRLGIAARQQVPDETIYPVVVDQANDAIAGDGQLYQEILTTANPSPLSLLLCCQYPGQLSDALAECVLSQVGTLLSFHLGGRTCVLHPKEMETRSEDNNRSPYVPHPGDDIPQLANYEFRVRQSSHEPYIATGFADHPRQCSNSEVATAIEQSLRTYGVPITSENRTK